MEPFDLNPLREFREQLRKQMEEMIEFTLFSGATASTTACEPVPPLTLDAVKEAAELLERRIQTRREKIVQSSGVMGPFGMKIIVSPYCYKTRVEVRGIADARRPNQKKMLYRRVTVQVPLMFLTKEGLVCHPAMESEIRKRVAAGDLVFVQNIKYSA